MSLSVVPVDSHLLDRFRPAGRSIAWRDASPFLPGTKARVAHLHDEESRVEERLDPGGVTLVAAAGPVGALVILLEVDRREEMPVIRSVPAGSDPAFVQGGISARWPRSSGVSLGALEVPIADLVALARYALV